MDKAIKQVHVYADPSEDNDDGKSSQKNPCPFNSSGSQSNTQNTQKKRKFNKTQTSMARRQSLSLGCLPKRILSVPRKRISCFLCLGDNPKKDCPTVKKAGPSKDKQVHMVQV